MKNTLVILLVCCLPAFLQAQTPSLERLWETDTVVAIPESVLADASGKGLYVSLIDGGAWDKDGKGGVGKLSADGKTYNGSWIKGLNAPKGLGRWGNKLYAADVDEVVVINVSEGKVEKKIAIDGAEGLNDITVDKKGVVYVSDSRTGKIHKIEKDIPTTYMEDLRGINGLMCSGDSLYILAQGKVLIAGADRKPRVITDLPNGGDGVELVGNGDLIVSEWVGYIYYVHADGRKDPLLDTHAERKNTADICYNAVTKTLYVPTFMAKTVTAYKLK